MSHSVGAVLAENTLTTKTCCSREYEFDRKDAQLELEIQLGAGKEDRAERVGTQESSRVEKATAGDFGGLPPPLPPHH